MCLLVDTANWLHYINVIMLRALHIKKEATFFFFFYIRDNESVLNVSTVNQNPYGGYYPDPRGGVRRERVDLRQCEFIAGLKNGGSVTEDTLGKKQ